MKSSYFTASLLLILCACGGGSGDKGVVAGGATPAVSSGALASPAAAQAQGDSTTTQPPGTTAPVSLPGPPLAGNVSGSSALVSCQGIDSDADVQLLSMFSVPVDRAACIQNKVSLTEESTIDRPGSAGFKTNGQTLELREFLDTNVIGTVAPSSRQVFRQSPSDVGAVGPFGELWWGRFGTQHVAIGQLFVERYYNGILTAFGLTVGERANRSIAFRRGEINPLPAVPKITYEQIAATRTTYLSTPALPLATVTNARLVLTTAKPISAVLTMTITRGDQSDNVIIPLRADTDSVSDKTDYRRVWAMKAAKAAGSQETCLAGRDGDNYRCTVETNGSFHVYAANAQFFGGNANYIAVRYETNIRASTQALAGYGEGLVILKHAL